jgi:hypothetical protein
MPFDSIPDPAHIRRLAFALTVVFLYAVFASDANAYTPTTWTIVIDASGPGPRPAGYTVNRLDVVGGTGCPYQNTDALLLKICKNDKVQWQTKQASADLWIFDEGAILDDPSGNRTHFFHGTGGQPAGGFTDGNTAADITTHHEYFIFISVGQTPYFQDPKIIVGGGGKIAGILLDNIQNDTNELLAKYPDNPDVQKLSKDVDKDVRAVKQSLQLQDESKQDYKDHN